MPSNAIVRNMQLDDIPTLAEMQGQYTHRWSAPVLTNELNNPISHNIVALLDDCIVGFASFWRVDIEVELQNIFVKRTARGKGIASLLLTEMLAEAKACRLKRCLLEVSSLNSEAIYLYGKFGFLTDGVRKNYYSSEKADAVLMSKRITADSFALHMESYADIG